MHPSNNFQNPNNIGGNQTPRSPIREAMPHIILRGAAILCILVLVIFILYVVAIGIHVFGGLAEKFFFAHQ